MLCYAPVAPLFPGVIAAPMSPTFAGMGAVDRLAQPMGLDPMGGMMQQPDMNQTLMYLVGLLAGLMAQQQGGGSALASPFAGGLDTSAGSSGGGGSSAGGVGTMGSNVPLGEGKGVQNFIDKATSHQGAPYVFGASGNGKYDCSGLVYASLKEAGVNVPRLTAAGYQERFKDSAVDRNNLKPGDLLFFHSKNDRGIPDGKATHIEIYLGNGMSMGTDSPKEGAKIEPVDWSHFIGGARVPQLYQQ